jgi:MFS family permease
MLRTVGSFFSLYLATLLLLLGTGLFNTYLGIRLTEANVSEIWIGSLIAVFYLGLVLGARTAHRLISGVGHIRAYVSAAAVVTVAVLLQSLVFNLWVWLGLRFLVGLAMVTQFIVLESWLNEQTDNTQRGRVVAFYMVFSGLGTVLGQLALTLFPELDYKPLIFAGICSVLCLMPVALTRRVHPETPQPAPIRPMYYLRRAPMSLTVVLIGGVLTGAFYGLGPVFAYRHELSSDQVALFVAVAVAAGLVAQWPMGYMADRINRAALIRMNALLLALFSVPMWGWLPLPYWGLLALSAAFGILQFTLYPLGAAFANDNVEPERRVGLSAVLLMVYGLGAGIGPLVVGAIMRHVSADTFFMFVAACAAVLVAYVRPQRVTGDNLSQDAPTQFVPMTEIQTAPVIASLDPRVDPESDVSHQSFEENAGPQAPDIDPLATEVAVSAAAGAVAGAMAVSALAEAAGSMHAETKRDPSGTKPDLSTEKPDPSTTKPDPSTS